MSDKLGVAKAEDLKSLFLLYRFSTEDHASKDTRVQRTDIIDVLAVAGYVGIPCLPIIWQTARASVGLGGTSSIRRAPLDAQTELAFKLVKDEEKVFAKADDIFSLIWNEIRILGHPQLRDHRNIVDLLGICVRICPCPSPISLPTSEKKGSLPLTTTSFTFFHTGACPVYGTIKLIGSYAMGASVLLSTT